MFPSLPQHNFIFPWDKITRHANTRQQMPIGRWWQGRTRRFGCYVRKSTNFFLPLQRRCPLLELHWKLHASVNRERLIKQCLGQASKPVFLGSWRKWWLDNLSSSSKEIALVLRFCCCLSFNNSTARKTNHTSKSKHLTSFSSGRRWCDYPTHKHTPYAIQTTGKLSRLCYT